MKKNIWIGLAVVAISFSAALATQYFSNDFESFDWGNIILITLTVSGIIFSIYFGMNKDKKTTDKIPNNINNYNNSDGNVRIEGNGNQVNVIINNEKESKEKEEQKIKDNEKSFYDKLREYSKEINYIIVSLKDEKLVVIDYFEKYKNPLNNIKLIFRDIKDEYIALIENSNVSLLKTIDDVILRIDREVKRIDKFKSSLEVFRFKNRDTFDYYCYQYFFEIKNLMKIFLDLSRNKLIESEQYCNELKELNTKLDEMYTNIQNS